jgi:pyruvate/2-oxoacid:ferredoxin oxidoreductase beta subunit
MKGEKFLFFIFYFFKQIKFDFIEERRKERKKKKGFSLIHFYSTLLKGLKKQKKNKQTPLGLTINTCNQPTNEKKKKKTKNQKPKTKFIIVSLPCKGVSQLPRRGSTSP